MTANRNAIPLAQTGKIIPFTVTSHLNMNRANCSTATRAKKIAALAVKGFTRVFSSSI
jgi:hypothetical protein